MRVDESFANDVAVQMAYLVNGIEPVLRQHRIDCRITGDKSDHQLTEASGHIGMVSDLLPYAKIVSTYLRARAAEGQDFPGVFEYEVTEELGTWMASTPEVDNDTFTEELNRLGAEFFSQNPEVSYAPL